MADDDKPLKLAGAAADTTTEEADSAATTHEEQEGEEGTLSSTSNAWGPLELRRTIGQGRFGTVYVAWDPELEREVALKILREADQSAAVIQEARLLARVRHPNVVTVYGVDRHENAVGLWMELVEGLTLKQVLAARGVLGAQEAALIGIDLCRAVAAVHKAGLLHRDIKVHNVMREAGGRIVLMDFGAGEIRAERVVGGHGGSGRRRMWRPKSSMAPRRPSPATSTAWACVLYHLVTKKYPVEGETVDADRGGACARAK